MKPTALVLCGIVLGSCVGAAFSARVSAQTSKPSVPAVRWENACEAVPNLQEANRIGALRGEAGWELVSLGGGMGCFKRPLVVPASGPSWPGY